MKKFFALLLTFLFIFTLCTACVTAPATDLSEGSSTEDPSSADHTSAGTEAPVIIDVLALKGPTAMGMVHMMEAADSGELTEAQYNFSILGSADEIGPRLTKGEADIAALPANLAANLYNNTDGSIRVLAINTLGVLYIVESGDSIHSVEDMRGKTIYAAGKGTTPEYALNHILAQNGIDPTADVTIEWKSEQAELLSALLSQDNAIAIMPQPFVTTARSKSEKIRVALDLTEEWDKLQTGASEASALVTGVVVARTGFIEEHPEAVSAFMDHYRESVDFVTSHTEESAQLVGKYDIVPAEVAVKALPACNITFIEGDELREKLSGYLTVLFEQNPKSVGGSVPDEAFYFQR